MRYKNQILSYITISILLLAVLTGCWDNRDVTEINIVTAAGLDKTPDGKIKVVVEIPKPSLLRQSDGGGGSPEEAAVFYTSTGDTFFEAVRNFLNTIDKKLFWSKLELLVIGENLAEDGVAEVIDFLERDPEINITAQVLINKNPITKETMAFKSELQKIPSVHLVNLLKNNEKALGTAYSKRIIDFINDMSASGRASVIPVLEVSSTGEELSIINATIEGSAIFKAGKLIGYLTPEQTRGWLLTDDKSGSTIFTIANLFDETKMMSYEMGGESAKMSLDLKDGKPAMSLDIKVTGNIGESQASGDFTKPEMINEIKQRIEGTIKGEVEKTIRTAQDLEADIFGFGEIYRRKYTSEWKEIEDQWGETFSNTPIDVKVEAAIERAGYIQRPVTPR